MCGLPQLQGFPIEFSGQNEHTAQLLHHIVGVELSIEVNEEVHMHQSSVFICELTCVAG